MINRMVCPETTFAATVNGQQDQNLCWLQSKTVGSFEKSFKARNQNALLTAKMLAYSSDFFVMGV